MATRYQLEALPLTYPDAPSGLSDAAAAYDAAIIWQRIEAYTVWRWSERTVEWIVEGDGGDWRPPLAPVEFTSVEVWRGNAWQEATPDPSPFGGFVLDCEGPYRIRAVVGDNGEPPAAVLEAFRRLAEYMASDPGKPGASSESVSAGSVSVSHSRSAEWQGRAMINSGAADLLRRYRSVGC